MEKVAVKDVPRERYAEVFRSADLSVGVYRVAKGAADDQKPHAEDEVYHVLAGKARFTSGRKTVEVRPGDLLFVPAGEKHRFHDVEEDLAVLVVFGPAEGTRGVTPADARPSS